MDSNDKSSQAKAQSLRDDDLEPTHVGPPSYHASFPNAQKGQTVLDPYTSNIPLNDITPSAPSAPSADPDSKPNTAKPTMDYTRPSQPHPRQQIDYKVPFGETSVPIQCPVCQRQTVSKTKPVSGGYTYGWAVGLCAVACLGCIPFCMGRLKNVEHRCGGCDEKLATWHRYGGRVAVHAWS